MAINQRVTGLLWKIWDSFTVSQGDLSEEDINQIGTIGLIKAIDKFDDSFDVKLSTYAVPMIAGEIKRFFRDDGMLKVSRSLKENGYRIKRASDELVNRNGREATIEELAGAVG